MKDNDISHANDTNTENDSDDSDKGTVGKVSPSAKKAAAKPRSSGRGLYITAIVLGILIVLLLALYIFLALTYKKPAHSGLINSTPTPVLLEVNQARLSLNELV